MAGLDSRNRRLWPCSTISYPKTLKLEYEVILTKSFKGNWLITNLSGLLAQPVAAKPPD